MSAATPDDAESSGSADETEPIEDLAGGPSSEDDAAKQDSGPTHTDEAAQTEEPDDGAEQASANVDATLVTGSADHDTVTVSATGVTSTDHESALLSTTTGESVGDATVENTAVTTQSLPSAETTTQTGPLAFVSNLVAALSPLIVPTPAAPAEPPLVWAVLAWVRRNFFNQTPSINYNTAQTVQTGQVITGNIGATDPEGDRLTYTVTQAPQRGTVTIDQTTGDFTYTPNSTNYTTAQTDSFTVSVTDGKFNLLSFWRPHADQETIGVTLRLSADYVDPVYNAPVIDSREDMTGAVPYHKVVGHFAGTDKQFTIYLPPADQWDGRFFQSVYPLDDENAEDEVVAFGAASGAYTVQTNGGGGFRVDAAAAKFAKTVAAEYYGSSDRIYGYVWGGSGGSYQTVGAIESTIGVWDGAVPFVIGVPTSFLNYNVRAMARLVLANKAAEISDAVSPGGSGDPYVGLNDTERAVLAEVTNMGIPLRAWEDYRYLLGMDQPNWQSLLLFGAQTRALDPTYADDFWSKPGYLGTEQSALGDLYRAAKFDQPATVTSVDRDGQGTPLSLTIDTAPINPRNTPLDLTVYSADGATIYGRLSGTLDPATRTIALGAGNNADVLSALDAGARIRIDNRWSLALTAYARHQVPNAVGGYEVFDQYRGLDGRPLYPQRPLSLSPLISSSISGGGTHTGMIAGKVIVVANLLDADAFPWHGDWYSSRVQNALGDRYDDSFRLWFNDNADHHPEGRTSSVISYTGILQRALRDLSDWVERDLAPAHSTRYTVADGQIHVPLDATERRGTQPVVHLTANGADRIEVSAGQQVTFHADIEVPPDAGRVTGLEWDPTGTGSFTPLTLQPGAGSAVQVTSTFTYDRPGTYFAALRVTAHDDTDLASDYAGVANLGRVRVIVHDTTISL